MIHAVPASLHFRALIARSRIIDDIADALQAHPPTTPEAFSDAILALTSSGVQATTIAAAMEVSVPTITRWGQGAISPRNANLRFAAAALPDVARREAQALRAMTGARTAQAA